jgi:hypothetical protein
MDGVSLISSGALISVYDYFGADRDRSDKTFRIDGATGIRSAAGRERAGLAYARLWDGRLWLEVSGTGPWSVLLIDMRGRPVMDASLGRAGPAALKPGNLPAGMYRLIVTGGGRTESRLLPWLP